MEQLSPQPMDQDIEITRFSDDDDARLFESCGGDDPQPVSNILRIKRNDPTVNILEVGWGANLDDAASRRLGVFVGRNTHLEELVLRGCHLDMEAMCAGLQQNRSIQKFRIVGIGLQNSETMSRLAPFLTKNQSLKNISLQKCRIGQASIDVLANALSNSTGSNLEELDLGYNPIGDNMDRLIQLLIESRCLRILRLSFCGIGPRACASLGTLLENPESNLTELYLGGNWQHSIDNQSSITLAGSLVNNKKLQSMDLWGNNGITTEGWSSMLQLVFNSSSVNNLINSNHILHSLARGSHRLTKRIFIQALGVDGGNLLHASLELNEGNNKLLIARRKIIWGHARGDFNLGEASIAWGAMPRILAWIGNDSTESDAKIVQYHDPPLREPDIGIARIGGIYRILRFHAGSVQS